MKKTILTAKDIAQWLGFSVNTVWELCRREEIPYIKVGGRYRFLEDRILEWLEEQ